MLVVYCRRKQKTRIIMEIEATKQQLEIIIDALWDQTHWANGQERIDEDIDNLRNCLIEIFINENKLNNPSAHKQ